MSTVRTLMIGVTVGAILGVLYAPAKGSDTRRRLAETGDDLKQRFNDLKDSINDKLDNFRDDMSEMADQEMERIDTEASAGRQPWQS